MYDFYSLVTPGTENDGVEQALLCVGHHVAFFFFFFFFMSIYVH